MACRGRKSELRDFRDKLSDCPLARDAKQVHADQTGPWANYGPVKRKPTFGFWIAAENPGFRIDSGAAHPLFGQCVAPGELETGALVFAKVGY